MEDGEQLNASLLEVSCNRNEESLGKKLLWKVAGPAFFTRISLIIAQVFIGHIGNPGLAALSHDFHHVLRFSIGWLMGLSRGLKTLCEKAYSEEEYDKLGIYLQSSWIVESIFAMPILLFLVFAGRILKLFGKTEDISMMANTIYPWYIPIIISFIFSYPLQMYLQTQSKNKIIAWMSAPSLCLHFLVSWVFVIKMGLGDAGVMLSLNIATWLPIVGQLIYIFYGGCPRTWTGFSMHAFEDLWTVVKQSISSGLMLCLEIWYSLGLILLRGNMKETKISIHVLSIRLNIKVWWLMLSFRLLAAVRYRCGC